MGTFQSRCIMKVMVTGACGYIGSHLVKRLAEAGSYYVIAVTNRYTENSNLVQYLADEYVVSTNDNPCRSKTVDTIAHLGGYISVEESVKNPMKYYTGNLQKTCDLLRYNSYDNIVFASTAAAFDPVSPYAISKLACEDIIKQLSKNYTLFRFFNVSGINPGHHYVNPVTHIMNRLAQSITLQTTFKLNGNDYDTKDGTCIRDYVDINDLIGAIVKAINIPANTNYECLGSGIGYSNLEVLETMQTVTGKHINYEINPRREGDAPKLIVDNVSDYMTVTRDLADMCRSTYEYFENKKNQ